MEGPHSESNGYELEGVGAGCLFDHDDESRREKQESLRAEFLATYKETVLKSD